MPPDNITLADTDPVGLYRAHLGDAADRLATLPEHMLPGIVRYVLFGVKPGSFLCSMMAGDIPLAMRRADAANVAALPSYVEFIRSGCPSNCRGGSRSVRDWCEAGGLLRSEVGHAAE